MTIGGTSVFLVEDVTDRPKPKSALTGPSLPQELSFMCSETQNCLFLNVFMPVLLVIQTVQFASILRELMKQESQERDGERIIKMKCNLNGMML